MKNLPLSSLLDMVKSGERQDEAFRELILRYSPLIQKKVLSFFSGEADILEATAEAEIALHSAAMCYDSDKCRGVTFGLYAGICIVNRLKTLVRSRRRECEMCDDSALAKQESGIDLEGQLALFELRERITWLARLILSDFEYRVFKYQLEGYTTREISRRLLKSGKSIDNAKARISRKLRENRDICAMLADMF